MSHSFLHKKSEQTIGVFRRPDGGSILSLNKMDEKSA